MHATTFENCKSVAQILANEIKRGVTVAEVPQQGYTAVPTGQPLTPGWRPVALVLPVEASEVFKNESARHQRKIEIAADAIRVAVEAVETANDTNTLYFHGISAGMLSAAVRALNEANGQLARVRYNPAQ